MRYILFLLICLTIQSCSIKKSTPKEINPTIETRYSITGQLVANAFDCGLILADNGPKAELQLKEYWYLKTRYTYETPRDTKLVLNNNIELIQGKVLATHPVVNYDDAFKLTWQEPINIGKKPWIFDVYKVREGEVIAPDLIGAQESPAYRVLAVELVFDDPSIKSSSFEPWVFFTGNEITKDVGEFALQCWILGSP